MVARLFPSGFGSAESGVYSGRRAAFGALGIDGLPKVLVQKGVFLGSVRAAGAGGSLWFRRMSDHSCVILRLWMFHHLFAESFAM
jgi:hypothetical protein